MCSLTTISLFYIGLLLVNAESNLLFTNGWIPVSSETVYEQIKRQNLEIPQYVPSQNIQVLHTDISNVILHKNTLKTTEGDLEEKPAAERKEDKEKFNLDKERCSFGGANCKQPNINVESTSVIQTTNEGQTAPPPLRRSKKIADFNARNYQQSLFLPENQFKHTKQRTYEVTENVSEIEQDDINSSKNGYTYEIPVTKNQSETLFKILAKYKISKDDVLPNYFLSRRHIVENTLQHGVSDKPIQNQMSYTNTYNSPNHLPVDPILAVLLSNYGFYVRGMYGRSNKYNNLYGYLASNNIHNNRPFGIYKIFSDTDSSH